MNKQEIFKDIPGYKGIYQASNLGRVKSLKFGKERILKPSADCGGYLTVILCKDGKQKAYKLHQLVAMAFLGHKLSGNKLVVDHLNNVRTDNRLENLQIVTSRLNSSKDKAGFTSKYVGVSWSKRGKKWRAIIYIDGKNKYLGYFKDEIEASKAYQLELNKIREKHF